MITGLQTSWTESLLPLRAFIKITHHRPTQHMSCMNYLRDLALPKSDIIAFMQSGEDYRCRAGSSVTPAAGLRGWNSWRGNIYHWLIQKFPSLPCPQPQQSTLKTKEETLHLCKTVLPWLEICIRLIPCHTDGKAPPHLSVLPLLSWAFSSCRKTVWTLCCSLKHKLNGETFHVHHQPAAATQHFMTRHDPHHPQIHIKINHPPISVI